MRNSAWEALSLRVIGYNPESMIQLRSLIDTTNLQRDVAHDDYDCRLKFLSLIDHPQPLVDKALAEMQGSSYTMPNPAGAGAVPAALHALQVGGAPAHAAAAGWGAHAYARARGPRASVCAKPVACRLRFARGQPGSSYRTQCRGERAGGHYGGGRTRQHPSGRAAHVLRCRQGIHFTYGATNPQCSLYAVNDDIPVRQWVTRIEFGIRRPAIHDKPTGPPSGVPGRPGWSQGVPWAIRNAARALFASVQATASI